MAGSLRAALEAWSLERKERAAIRSAGLALAEAGKQLCESPALPSDDFVRLHLAAIAANQEWRSALERSLAAALDEDRADYGTAKRWIRPLVIARGMLARAVLRDKLRSTRRELQRLHRVLAELALDGTHPELALCVQPHTAQAVSTSRTAAANAQKLREAVVAPYGGRPLPPWAEVTLRHTHGFGKHVALQARSKILPRAPALAAMAAAAWVAHHFTDSIVLARINSIRNYFGFGETGTWAVSPGTRNMLLIGLPILAAAIVAYGSSLFSAWVKRRYSPEGGPGAAPSKPVAR